MCPEAFFFSYVSTKSISIAFCQKLRTYTEIIGKKLRPSSPPVDQVECGLNVFAAVNSSFPRMTKIYKHLFILLFNNVFIFEINALGSDDSRNVCFNEKLMQC